MYSYSDDTRSLLFAASINIPGVRDWAVVIRCGQIKSLHLEDGLASVNMTAMKKLWRIADNVTMCAHIIDGGNWQRLN